MTAFVVNLGLAFSSPAQGQALDADQVQPSIEALRFMTVDDARMPSSRGTTARLWGFAASGLLEPPVGDLSMVAGGQVSVSGGWGNTRGGLSLPAYASTQGALTGPALGDLRAQARLLLLPGLPNQAGLGLLGTLSVPTGVTAHPLAPPSWAGELALVADLDRGPALVGLNAGMRLQPEALEGAWGDQVFTRVALALGPLPWLDFSAELHLAAPSAIFTQGLDDTWMGEGVFGLRLGPESGLSVRAYGALGLNESPGTADWRGALGLTWARWGQPDPDRDGVTGVEELCPDAAEDRDGFNDKDGCPDLDNDQDQVPDSQDACPDMPEDRDGTLDGDGCVDGESTLLLRIELPAAWPASAQVRLSSSSTAPDRPPDVGLAGRSVVELPLTAGEWTLDVRAPGYKSSTEVLKLPNDGLLEHTVHMQPLMEPLTLRLIVSDSQGQPLSAVAQQGEQRWTLNGEAQLPLPAGRPELSVSAEGYTPVTLQLSGLPGEQIERRISLEPAQRVGVEGRTLTIYTPIRFAPGLASPTAGSRETLDALARALIAHPELGVARIEGHCKGLPSEDINLSLSTSMAQAVVDALVARGVPRERLDPVGFGSAAGLPEDQAVTVFVQ